MTAMRKKWKYRIWIPVVALGLMNILAMKPARKGRVSMDVIQEYDYAHRGLYNVREGIAENTLPAFQRAVDKNCRYRAGYPSDERRRARGLSR